MSDARWIEAGVVSGRAAGIGLDQMADEPTGAAQPASPPSPPPGWHPDPQDSTSLRYWDGSGWTDNRAPASAAKPERSGDVATPATAALGALVMAIAAFLPLAESSTFIQVADNTLIQNGSGWVFLGLALGVILKARSLYTGGGPKTSLLIMGGLGLALAIYMGVSEEVLTLESAAGGSFSREEVASPGVGIYAAGIGSALVLFAGFGLTDRRD